MSETVTSQHDTCRIGEMFHLLKHNYKKVFGTALFFRYVVCDLSWATIHAMLETMNFELIDDFSKRIFKFASDKEVNLKSQKGFLASCISHTTHRFAKGLKRYVKFTEKEHKVFALCCFSLLANTTDLESTKSIFKLMCDAFLRSQDDDICRSSIQSLQIMIELRPNDRTEIIKCINEVFPQALAFLETNCDNSKGGFPSNLWT